MSFSYEYLREFEAIFKNALTYKPGAKQISFAKILGIQISRHYSFIFSGHENKINADDCKFSCRFFQEDDLQ